MTDYSRTTIPERTFNVNGRMFTPLDDDERERQHVVLTEKYREVEKDIAALAGPDEWLVSMTRCMTSFEYWCDRFAWTFDPRDLKDRRNENI